MTQSKKLLAVALMALFSSQAALATAELDDEYAPQKQKPTNRSIYSPAPSPEPGPSPAPGIYAPAPAINKTPAVIQSPGTTTETEKEIVSFTLPPGTAGNVLPHIPQTPPPPSLAIGLVSPLGNTSGFKPSLSWRLTAHGLFANMDKPDKNLIQLVLRADSKTAWHTIAGNAAIMGLKLKSTAENARQLLLEFNDAEKSRNAVIAVKDDPTNPGFSIVRVKILPYATRSATNLLNLYLTRIKSTLEMKDVL